MPKAKFIHPIAWISNRRSNTADLAKNAKVTSGTNRPRFREVWVRHWAFLDSSTVDSHSVVGKESRRGSRQE